MVEISFDGQSGKRQVSVRSCRDAADFVAVAVALAVDPSLAERVDLAGAEPAQATPQHPLEATAHGASNESPVDREAQSPAAGRGDARRRTWPLRPHLSATVQSAIGVLPGTGRLGAEAEVGTDIGRLSFSLGGLWFPPTGTGPERALAPIDFSLLAVRASAAYLLFGPRARAGPLLSADGGAIRARQNLPDSGLVIEPWVSLGAGALGTVGLYPNLSLLGLIELDVPLTQPSFVLTDGSEVHTVSVGARAALGLRFFLPGR